MDFFGFLALPVGLVSPVFLGVCVNFGQRLTTSRTSFIVSTHFGKFDKLLVKFGRFLPDCLILGGIHTVTAITDGIKWSRCGTEGVV